MAQARLKLAKKLDERYAEETEFTDAILVVEETKLHISKAVGVGIKTFFLSYCSQYTVNGLLFMRMANQYLYV